MGKAEFYHLLIFATDSSSSKSIRVPPPAIRKPVKLWTGKQLVGAVIDFIAKGKVLSTFLIFPEDVLD